MKGSIITLGGALHSGNSLFPGTNFNTPGPGTYESKPKAEKVLSKLGQACFLTRFDRSEALVSTSVAPPPNYYFLARGSGLTKSRAAAHKKSYEGEKRVRTFNLQLHATSVQDLIDRVIDLQHKR